jgi:glutathione synthase/RimK-type ligase-like ATP-grasp enzyme
MILILTDASDVHADRVVDALIRAEAPVFRLNLDVGSLRSTVLTIGKEEWTLKTSAGVVSTRQIRCVWCRRPTVSLTVEEEEDRSHGFRLWRSEWNRVLFGFYNALSDVFWMNNLRTATLADNKFYQMRVARSCNFNVPETITSNDKNILVKFAKDHDDIALKFMSQEMYRSHDGVGLGLYVNKITDNDLVSFQDIGENPITLQHYIEKDFEVRYTFIDGVHLVCKIESQLSDRARVDWRRYDVKRTPHSQLTPPKKVEQQVNKFMQRLSLAFGALDFIVDRDQNWWFLEVNTAGQWLWIEDLSALPISDTIFTCLISQIKGISP